MMNNPKDNKPGEIEGVPSFWEALKSVDIHSLDDFEPPKKMGPAQRTAWRLLKTVTDPMKGGDAAGVSAAKEILDRLYGKVPVVERRETALTLQDLDLSALTDEQLTTFNMLLQLAAKNKPKNGPHR